MDKEQILHGLKRLGEIALEWNSTFEIAIVDGAALMLSLNARAATRDVDAIFNGDAATVRKAASIIAAEEGWNDDWLTAFP